MRGEYEIGVTFHRRLNSGSEPIANKYFEGKLKSTSRGGLKVLYQLNEKTVHFVVLGGTSRGSCASRQVVQPVLKHGPRS